MSTENILGKNIKKFCKQKGLSQEKLARKADVANNTIIKIESGENNNPTFETMKRIAKALEIKLDNLINQI